MDQSKKNIIIELENLQNRLVEYNRRILFECDTVEQRIVLAKEISRMVAEISSLMLMVQKLTTK